MAGIRISFKGQGNIAFNLRGLVFSDPSADSFPVAITTLSPPVGETIQFATVKMDWKETPEAHIIKVDVPGLKKEQVKVVAQEGRILLIGGELIRDIKEENNYMWHRMERSPGKFLRRLKLRENAKMDQIKATMEDGLLTVTVPKMEDGVIKISDDVQMDQNGALKGKSTADKGKGKGKGKAVVEEAKDVVPETVPEETIKHVVGAVKLSGRKIKWE